MSDIKLKKIAIAGLGGLGSHLTSMLFDYGVNRNQFDFSSLQIDGYDADSIDLKNLLHQNFREEDIHRSKADVMAERYLINPIKNEMTAVDFKQYDLIFSCVDSMTFRKELYEWSWENPKGAFWIDGRCESRQGCLFNKTISKDKLQKFLSDNQERTGCLLKFEKENDISHVTPVIVAGMMMQTFLNYIRGVTPLPEKIFMI